MADFTVNTSGLREAAVSIKKQNRILEHADEVLGSVSQNLMIEGDVREKFRAALSRARCQVRVDMANTERIGTILQEIEETYQITERGLQERVSGIRKAIFDGRVEIQPIINLLYGAPPFPKIDFSLFEPQTETEEMWWLGTSIKELECMTLVLYGAPKWEFPHLDDAMLAKFFTTIKQL